ncbi:hypothetical protein BYT27DRAFT_7259317 [Phlegmacium glaucopus]|nr:hypothetical protein BYT27DRAFT_7259317 [Phlegmacium glaucopus]
MFRDKSQPSSRPARNLQVDMDHQTGTLKDSRSSINSPLAARKWLIKEELIIVGENISATLLSQALMWLAAGDKDTVEQLVDSIHSVALCLEQINGNKFTERAREEISKISRKWVEEATVELKRVAEEPKWRKTRGGETAAKNHQQDSYAQALAREWGKEKDRESERIHQDYRAKEAIKRRKILIDGLEGLRGAMDGLAPGEIVVKANLAINEARVEMDRSGGDAEGDLKVVAAKVLENGGVVLEMDSEESAA